MRYPQERKWFSESAAVFAGYQSNPRFKTVELLRFFSTSRTELQASGLAMLDRFTSAKNEAEIEANTAIDYIDSPAVSRGLVTYPGRWRLVSNKQGPDPTRPSEQGILQTLKLYRLTTILTTDDTPVIDFTMSRLIEYDHSEGNDIYFDGVYTKSADPAKMLVIEWAAIHPSKVADVIAEFAANFDSDLTFSVDGQSFTGLSYLFATIKDEDADKDGMKTVRFVVGRKEFALSYQGQLLSTAAFTGYILWGLQKDEAQTLIDNVIANHTQGITIVPEYNESLHTVTVRLRVRDSLDGYSYDFWGGQSCMEVQTVTLYDGYTKTALAALLTALASQVASGVWFTVSGISEDKESGLYSVSVTKHVAVEVYQTPQVSQLSGTSVGVTERGFNLKTSGGLPLAAFTAGRTQTRRIRKNPNCTEDVELGYEESYPVVLTAQTENSVSNTGQTSLYANSRTKIEVVVAPQGQLYKAGNTLNPDGTYNGQLVYDVSKALSWKVATARSKVGTEDKILYDHSRTKIEAQTAEQGGLYVAAASLTSVNPDGTYNGSLEYQKSTAVVLSAQTGDNLTGNEQTAIYANSRTKIEAGAVAQGQLYKAGNTLNPDGTYDGRLVYDYSKAAVLSAQTGDTAVGNEQTAIYANSRTKIEAGAVAQGEIYRAGNTLNPDGTYDGQLAYAVSKAAILSAQTGDTAVGNEQTAIYANSRTKIEAGAVAQGSIYRAGNTLNPDGTYNGQLVYDYSKAVMFSAQTGDSAVNREQTSLYANSRDRIEASDAAQGSIYRAGNTLNSDGTYNGQLVCDYSKAISEGPTQTGKSETHTEESTVSVNSRAAIAAAAASQGVQTRASNRINPDGTFDGTAVADTSIPVVLSAQTGDSVTNTEKAVVYANSRALVEAGTGSQGELYKAGNTINPDGTYNGQLIYDYSKAVSVLAQTGDSVTNTEKAVVYANSRAPVEAGTGSQGELYKAGNTINPDGTYNGQLIYDYSKAMSVVAKTADSGLGHEDTQVYANSRIKLDASTNVQGGIYRTNNTINPDGTYNGALIYQGSKAASVYWSWATTNGIASTSQYKNQSTIPSLAGLTYGTRNFVGVEINQDLTYNVGIHKFPIAGGGISTGSIIGDFTNATLLRRQYRSSFTELRTVTINSKTRLTTSRYRAYAFISGGADGSKVERDGNTYVATRYWMTFSVWSTMPTDPSYEAALATAP